MDFDPSSGVICVAPTRFKRWSRFNSEPPSDLRSNFDLGSTQWRHCFNSSARRKKLPDSNPNQHEKLICIDL